MGTIGEYPGWPQPPSALITSQIRAIHKHMFATFTRGLSPLTDYGRIYGVFYFGWCQKGEYSPPPSEIVGPLRCVSHVCTSPLSSFRTNLAREKRSCWSPRPSCNSCPSSTLQHTTSAPSLKDLATRQVPFASTKGTASSCIPEAAPCRLPFSGNLRDAYLNNGAILVCVFL